jgi:type IV pilus assembly protein PilW
MKRACPASRAASTRGFSIVELMVSVVIGLLALMFATRLIAGGEVSKQNALGGSDAMQNGITAMFSISGDISQAGFGLNDPILAGCDTLMLDTGGTGYQMLQATRGTSTSITPLAAAVIQNNGLDPDKIALSSGGAITGTGSARLTEAYGNGAVLAIDRKAYGFALNDVIVVAPEVAPSTGSKCSLVQLSAAPNSGTTLNFAAGAGLRFNNGTLGNAFSIKSRVFNLGPASKLAFHTWSVKNGFLQLAATDVAGTEVTAATVADNIVSIKAQYGFDTRVGTAFTPESGTVVSEWKADMIDADKDTVVGSAGDYQRISAIRLAVVARSKTAERPAADGTCDATLDSQAPEVFKVTQAGTTAPASIKPNVIVTGDTVNWKCYRYRVFETVVPIRNTAWRPTAWAK